MCKIFRLGTHRSTSDQAKHLSSSRQVPPCKAPCNLVDLTPGPGLMALAGLPLSTMFTFFSLKAVKLDPTKEKATVKMKLLENHPKDC